MLFFSNCSISNKIDNRKGALFFNNTQSSSLSHVTVINTANIPSEFNTIPTKPNISFFFLSQSIAEEFQYYI